MQNDSPDASYSPAAIFLFLLVIASVGFSFYKYYFLQDYELYVKESCDPALEECLSEECEEGDPRCIPSPDGLRYYKEIYRKANSVR